MNARKKNKKKIIICLLIILAVILFTILIVIIGRNNKQEIEKEKEEEQVYELPNTTYTGMEVSNVRMEYLKDNNETMVTFVITNTTDRVVEKENLLTHFISKDGEILKTTGTFINKLDVNEQYEVSVVLKGDLTPTAEISLQTDSTNVTTTEETNATNTTTEESNTTNETNTTNTSET